MELSGEQDQFWDNITMSIGFVQYGGRFQWSPQHINRRTKFRVTWRPVEQLGGRLPQIVANFGEFGP